MEAVLLPDSNSDDQVDVGDPDRSISSPRSCVPSGIAERRPYPCSKESGPSSRLSSAAVPTREVAGSVR